MEGLDALFNQRLGFQNNKTALRIHLFFDEQIFLQRCDLRLKAQTTVGLFPLLLTLLLSKLFADRDHSIEHFWFCGVYHKIVFPVPALLCPSCLT